MAYEPVPLNNTTLSKTLAHYATVYYKKRGLDRLMKKFHFDRPCEHDILPRQSGRVVQFFRYNNMAANTTPKSPEGAVGTSQSVSSRVLTAYVSQYSDFITLSDLLVDTAIDPVVQSMAELLGYRAGLSVDTITRTIIDAEFSNASVSPLDTTNNKIATADFRNVRAILTGADVEPFDDGYFIAIMHPYVTYDLLNDSTANSLIDIQKYTKVPGEMVKPEDRGHLATVAGFKIYESTNVWTQATPARWRAYFFGKGGVGCVDLEGRGPNRITDPKKQRFDVSVIRGERSIYDPEGIIGAAVSYKFVYTAVVLEGPSGIGGTYRFRLMNAASGVVAS